MEANTLALLCDPQTHEPLQFANGVGPAGRLVNPVSGRTFPLRDGMALFLDGADVTASNRRYQRLYDRLAPLYDLSMEAYALVKSGGLKQRRWEYLRELEVGAGSRVLEVSVGTGANWRYLPPTAQYFGLDISWGMLKRCQRRVRQWGLRAELFQGAAEHLPFREGTFDAVLHMGGINFFNDIGRALREMVRVARPGTKFVIVDETEDFARSHETTAGASAFYAARPRTIAAPVDDLPSGMREVQVRDICGGELYCLTFRKPGPGG